MGVSDLHNIYVLRWNIYGDLLDKRRVCYCIGLLGHPINHLNIYYGKWVIDFNNKQCPAN